MLGGDDGVVVFFVKDLAADLDGHGIAIVGVFKESEILDVISSAITGEEELEFLGVATVGVLDMDEASLADELAHGFVELVTTELKMTVIVNNLDPRAVDLFDEPRGVFRGVHGTADVGLDGDDGFGGFADFCPSVQALGHEHLHILPLARFAAESGFDDGHAFRREGVGEFCGVLQAIQVRFDDVITGHDAEVLHDAVEPETEGIDESSEAFALGGRNVLGLGGPTGVGDPFHGIVTDLGASAEGDVDVQGLHPVKAEAEGNHGLGFVPGQGRKIRNASNGHGTQGALGQELAAVEGSGTFGIGQDTHMRRLKRLCWGYFPSVYPTPSSACARFSLPPSTPPAYLGPISQLYDRFGVILQKMYILR